MGLSAVKPQQKTCNLICNNCNAKSENLTHFMLCSPAYAAHQQQIIHEVTWCVPHVMQELSDFQTV